MRRTAAVIALLIVPLLALSGCTPAPPVATQTPTPSGRPLFANEEEALKAATEAYAAYLKVSDEILADGGANPERLASVTSKKLAEDELSGFTKFVDNGYHAVGSTTFDVVKIQDYHAESESRNVISVYLCVDVSGVDVLDREGKSIVSAQRPDKQAFEAHFDRYRGTDLLVVSENSVWKTAGVCN